MHEGQATRTGGQVLGRLLKKARPLCTFKLVLQSALFATASRFSILQCC